MSSRSSRGSNLEITRLLQKKGLLLHAPTVIERTDLQYAEGYDIVYDFKGLTPAKFKEYSDSLLWLAYEEARGREDFPTKFARFEVQVNKTIKGRKSSDKRTYAASGNPDPSVMVFGEEALGYSIPEKMKKPFLVNKVEDILDIPTSYMKDNISKQRPYKVLSLVISVRKKRPAILEFRKARIDSVLEEGGTPPKQLPPGES